eukprot:957150-Pelagomonas_calceolata.AAC.2
MDTNERAQPFHNSQAQCLTQQQIPQGLRTFRGGDPPPKYNFNAPGIGVPQLWPVKLDLNVASAARWLGWPRLGRTC